jgi:hypothetical protein
MSVLHNLSCYIRRQGCWFNSRGYSYEIQLRLSQEMRTVKNLYSPVNLPRLVARHPYASFRMSWHTASGRQVRGCAKLNRSKAIQKRCASCGSKGTFDFRLSFFSVKFMKRILQRTPPPGRQGGHSASRLSHLRCSTSLAQRMGHPEYREPCPVQMGVVATRCHLSPFAFFRPASSPSGCVNGNRETQREGFKSSGFTRSVAGFVTG